jgi:hypothetical protein
METKLEQIAAKAVKQRPKSVVREIRTPRSVGTGGGRPPPVTRWAPSNGCPYRNREMTTIFEPSCFWFRASSDYAGVGVALHLGSLTLRRRGPNWNATKRRRDSERRASTAAE